MSYSPEEIEKRLLKMGYTPSEIQEKLFKKALNEFNTWFQKAYTATVFSYLPIPLTSLNVDTLEERIEFTKAWNAYMQDLKEP
jgi:hypothetical protein